MAAFRPVLIVTLATGLSFAGSLETIDAQVRKSANAASADIASAALKQNINAESEALARMLDDLSLAKSKKDQARAAQLRESADGIRARLQQTLGQQFLGAEWREMLQSARDPSNFSKDAAFIPDDFVLRYAARESVRDGSPSVLTKSGDSRKGVGRSRDVSAVSRADPPKAITKQAGIIISIGKLGRIARESLDGELLAVVDSQVYASTFASPVRPQTVRSLSYDKTRNALVLASDANVEGKPVEFSLQLDDPRFETKAGVIRHVLRQTNTVVIDGVDANVWREYFSLVDTRSVHRVQGSPNATSLTATRATELGDVKVPEAALELLNGLPNFTGRFADYWHAWRMGLGLWSVADWRQLRSSLHLPKGIRALDATADRVSGSLQHGDGNIIILVAHNDGTHLHFSGTEKLAIQDLRALSRPEAPDRIVLLITCEGAAAGDLSIADILIKNKLARTVLANTGPVDATKLQEMLNAITRESVAEALKLFGFWQFVKDLNEGCSSEAQDVNSFSFRFGVRACSVG